MVNRNVGIFFYTIISKYYIFLDCGMRFALHFTDPSVEINTRWVSIITMARYPVTYPPMDRTLASSIYILRGEENEIQ